MNTRACVSNNKAIFMKALGLQPQSKLKIIAHKILEKCKHRSYDRFKGVQVVKNELKTYNLTQQQYNEVLNQCAIYDNRWRDTNNWDYTSEKGVKINKRHIYRINFNSKTKEIKEYYYIKMECYVINLH
ncbi:p15 protein [Thysanoplusia orichalcea nucleopolyhedrovirus]|uniref:p15 protein n=1 Tax=Thysanoplusia orichalcea nucleopolyhedrovirus TaxID=101850 RepID=L0CLN6_9ABAC|nr:p15 protein [Thysanoplusia orichalcea nucleopolyhedrovirus]AGA16238.1 p15 protein [Thysanoplusia orichalcea nucleopolyhedrovirus]